MEKKKGIKIGVCTFYFQPVDKEDELLQAKVRRFIKFFSQDLQEKEK